MLTGNVGTPCQFCGRMGIHDCKLAETPETMRDRIAIAAMGVANGDPEKAYAIADRWCAAREPIQNRPPAAPKKAG